MFTDADHTQQKTLPTFFSNVHEEFRVRRLVLQSLLGQTTDEDCSPVLCDPALQSVANVNKIAKGDFTELLEADPGNL